MMEKLAAALDRLIDKLQNPDEFRAHLEDLISVYPFNEYEYIISTLLGADILTLDNYYELRDEYIARNLYLYVFEIGAPRGFGEKWAQGHLKSLVPSLQKPSKKTDTDYSGQYDFILVDNDKTIKIEVKASRAVDADSDEPLYIKALAADSRNSMPTKPAAIRYVTQSSRHIRFKYKKIRRKTYMLIIDADTHIAPTGGAFALEEHLKRMERAGIDKTITWLKPDYHGEEIEGHNRYVYAAMRQYPDKILGFGWADPTVSVDHAKKMVRVCAEEYGLYGVKLNGAQNNYRIDDPTLALPVIEEIAKAGVMLAFHIGADFYENTHPFRAERVARMYPEMPVLMVHIGMLNWDMNQAVVEIAQRCPNMFLVGSSTTETAIMYAIKTLGAERVLFGTDAPFQRPHVVRAMYEAALADDVNPAEHDLIMGGNAARLFNL